MEEKSGFSKSVLWGGLTQRVGEASSNQEQVNQDLGWGRSSVMEYLSSMYKVFGLIPSTADKKKPKSEVYSMGNELKRLQAEEKRFGSL